MYVTVPETNQNIFITTYYKVTHVSKLYLNNNIIIWFDFVIRISNVRYGRVNKIRQQYMVAVMWFGILWLYDWRYQNNTTSSCLCWSHWNTFTLMLSVSKYLSTRLACVNKKRPTHNTIMRIRTQIQIKRVIVSAR